MQSIIMAMNEEILDLNFDSGDEIPRMFYGFEV